MSHVRLVWSRARITGPRDQRDPPCLEAFRAEFDYLIRSLLRLGVARDDVEDLAQEVFLVLHETWGKYDSSRPFRAYLFGIAFRVAFAYRRKSSREIPRAEMEITDARLRADQEIEQRQRRALVLSALDRVPLARRAVLVMHDIDEIPMTEVASNLSINLFAAYARLRKARKEFAAAVVRLRNQGDA